MEFLIGIFFFACLIWVIPLLRTGAILRSAMVILVVGTVFGTPFFYIDGPIQLSIDRILWFGLMGSLFLGLRLGFTKFPKLNRADCLMAGIVGWFFIAAATGGPAVPKTNPIAPWLFFTVIPAGMYVAARVVTITKKDAEFFVSAFLGLGLYLAITAVCEWRGWHFAVFPKYIVDPEQWEFFGRARGPLMQPAGNGVLLGACLAAAISRFMNGGRAGKTIYGAIAMIMLMGMYATLTRSVWIGAALVVCIFVLLYSPRWVRVLGLIAATALAGAMFLGLKDQITNLKRDKQLTAEDAAKSVKLRPLLAIVGYEMFKDRPIKGHGLGRYKLKSVPYHANRTWGVPLEQARGYIQHNVVLSILVDTGLLGLSLFMGWVSVLTLSAWQLIRQRTSSKPMRAIGAMAIALLAVYFFNGMFHDVTLIVMVNSFLFFVGGVVVTVHQQASLPAAASQGRVLAPIPRRQPIAQ